MSDKVALVGARTLTISGDSCIEEAMEELQETRPALERITAAPTGCVTEGLDTGGELVGNEADVGQMGEVREVPALHS